MILFGLAWWEKKLKGKYEPDDRIKEAQRQYYERNYPQNTEPPPKTSPESRKK
jgi:hypothetical protein